MTDTVSPEANHRLDWTKIRQRLADSGGRDSWRSLSELAETPEFTEFLKQEFPQAASLAGTINSLNRREFLKLMGASLAMAGLASCVPQPQDKLLPYVNAPAGMVPGRPTFYATAIEQDGYGRGLLIRSREGRPIKAEGNPSHPASLGASEMFAQASLLTLYDPERARLVTKDGNTSTWDDFLKAITQALGDQQGKQGAGLRLLTGTVTSPTLGAQIKALLEKYPQAKWHQYDAVSRDNVRIAAQQAFGNPVETTYRFDQADVILSLDSDFLYVWEPGTLRYAADFAKRRRVLAGQNTSMNRLYVVESTLTVTGTNADHHLPLQAGQIEAFARLVASQLGVQGVQAGQVPGLPNGWVEALVSDLKKAGAKALVVPGAQQSVAVHVLAHAMNAALGSAGQTVIYTEPVEVQPIDQNASLRELSAALDAGQVDILVVTGTNPVYTAPADLSFGEKFKKARLKVYVGLYGDETAALATWFVPAAHYLESWGDIRAFDGTATIIQPLIEPLYGGKSAHELLAVLNGNSQGKGYDIVRGFWQQAAAGNFDQMWKKALKDGVVPNTALQPKSGLALAADLAGALGSTAPQKTGLEIVFQPDATIWDGRWSNNAWLQELGKPQSKLTWDNAAFVAPETAQRLGISDGDMLELSYKGRKVTAPAMVMPGHARDSIAVQLGYGRSGGITSSGTAGVGSVASGKGYNAYALRTSDAPWFGYGLEVRKTGQQYTLATMRAHHSMEGRDLARMADLKEFQQDPATLGDEDKRPQSLYPEFTYNGHAWGMSINLGTCIGCNYCVVACQAENNIPVVGKDQVDRGREMHWLRIDQYFTGGPENPQVANQPVPCMHCENAPCESVCPVEATVHSAEGLNDMVYNRCVGTRYCSNNCPYKVRRFNFYQYADFNAEPLKMLPNPEVTVRMRGVMEKCTYCVQRINQARIRAEEENRPVRENEVMTACQQACPTQAIVFGNMNDKTHQVSGLKAQPHDYALLGELNTRPRTTYLTKVRNPNPAIQE